MYLIYNFNIPSFSKASRFGKEVRYYDPVKKKFVTTEDQENLENEEKIKLSNENLELMLRRKFQYLNSEALSRLEKKNKAEMFKVNNTELEELRLRAKIGPGVWSYEPDYYKWGKTGPSYSILGRVGKGFLDVPKNNDNYDSMMNLGVEGSAKSVVNSLKNGLVTLPNFGSIQNSPPKYSFAKSKDRFKLPSLGGKEETVGPGSFYKSDYVTINKNKNKVL